MPTSNCPECEEEIYVDADSEQGDEVTCADCGARLTVVGLDPIELDLKTDADEDDYKDDDYNSFDGDDRY